MADAQDSNSGASGKGGQESMRLLTKIDKAVSTNDILLDLQRALTYEAVFSILVEHKMQALRRDYEEHKRAKRAKKRKSIGRIFLPRKLFGGGRRGSREEDSAAAPAEEPQTPSAKTIAKAKTKPKGRGKAQDDIEVASGSVEASLRSHGKSAEPLEDSLASNSLSNSSGPGPGRQAIHIHSLLVHAQTHTPAKTDLLRRSGSSEEENGSGYDNTSTTATATATVITAERGGVLHSSTLADDSLTASLRGSIESLSYSSSRCTVSFGGAEIIAVAGLDANTRERVRLAKRLRILEAKSISAQCSPIFPRHVVRSFPLQAPQQARLHINVPSSLAKQPSPPPPPWCSRGD
ncbi:uncharacterized protein LOC117193500 [Drosophila miranda]|uniref:uncharacterized protein LOC117193500 n=1 Tax=Drosophila miranda TaxID=7229 RepID=UPI00143F2500|nr:uncharacterized protein LOC117193500 [Drosophila miranda]